MAYGEVTCTEWPNFKSLCFSTVRSHWRIDRGHEAPLPYEAAKSPFQIDPEIWVSAEFKEEGANIVVIREIKKSISLHSRNIAHPEPCYLDWLDLRQPILDE